MSKLKQALSNIWEADCLISEANKLGAEHVAETTTFKPGDRVYYKESYSEWFNGVVEEIIFHSPSLFDNKQLVVVVPHTKKWAKHGAKGRIKVYDPANIHPAEGPENKCFLEELNKLRLAAINNRRAPIIDDTNL